MTKARDEYIQYLKERIKFYQGRGAKYDLVVAVLKEALMKAEALTRW